MILGKISNTYTDGLKLIIDGEDEPTTKVYRYLASYVPSNGDRVLVEEIGDSYVVLGKVINQYSDSGKARTAVNADNADSADTATKATTATSATKATQDESGNNIKATYGASVHYSNGTLYLRNKNGSNISNTSISTSTSRADGVTNTSSTGTTIYFRVNGSTFSAATSKNGPWYNLN